jgi:hypothetical protein
MGTDQNGSPRPARPPGVNVAQIILLHFDQTSLVKFLPDKLGPRCLGKGRGWNLLDFHRQIQNTPDKVWGKGWV